MTITPDRKSARRLASHRELANWIEDCVLGDLRTLRLGMDIRTVHSGAHFGGGNFLLLAGCLMALEYFARIYAGHEDSVSCVRAYSSNFLGKIDARYVEACGIFWRIARNGMLHGSWPLRVSLQGANREFRLSVGNERSDAHLTLNGDLIGVSAPRFLDDLETSVATGFAAWVRNSTDPQVLDRGQPRVLEIMTNDEEGVRELSSILQWNTRDAFPG